MTTSNSVVATISQAPKKWYIKGNWASSSKQPVFIGSDGNPIEGQQVVYLAEFPDSETGFVQEAAFQKKTMYYARQKEARKLQVELQKEVKDCIVSG
jgi:hypothetical protein